MPKNPNASVRPMKPSEMPIVVELLTNSFINDPTMNFYGYVPSLVKDPAHPTHSEQDTISNLRVFQDAMTKVIQLVGGAIDVVVVPSAVHPLDKQRGEQRAENIVAVAQWLPPGVTLEFTLSTVLRAGIHKVAFAWGLGGMKVSSSRTHRRATLISHVLH